MNQTYYTVQAVLPLVIVLLALVFVVIRTKNTHFECPICGCSFKLSALNYALTPHMFFKRLVTCPNCGHRDWMPTIRDDEE